MPAGLSISSSPLGSLDAGLILKFVETVGKDRIVGGVGRFGRLGRPGGFRPAVTGIVDERLRLLGGQRIRLGLVAGTNLANLDVLGRQQLLHWSL